MAHAAGAPRPVSLLPGGYLVGESTGVGQESTYLEESAAKSFEHFSEPYLRSWGSPFVRFLVLKMKWERETAHLSSAREMAIHPAYQQIIGMGPAVVPYILADLKSKPDHWFWALRAITGGDPVLPEHRGRIRQMADDWLVWGRQQGYSV
jgi:hypothetical protein